MARFTILSWNGAGNQPPAIGMAQALRDQGHEVTFAGYEGQRSLFAGRGFAFRRLDRASAAWRDGPPENTFDVKVKCAWASFLHLDDVEDMIVDTHPDVIVVDCLMFGALAALERSGVPTAVFVHSAPGALLPPKSTFETALLEPVNRVRAAAGRPYIERLWAAWESFPTFCNSIRQLDPQASEVPAAFGYVGPINERIAPSGWQSPWSCDDGRPLVLVSFSTGPYWDQGSRIRRTLEALGNRDCRVLVTGGGADLGTLAVPKNAIVVRHVPHAEVMPRVAITVTHAGHGTVMASLAHGVPLVCLPNRAADQPMLGARVASLGVGKSLDGDSATPIEIGAAVEQIMGDSICKIAARRLATEIARTPGVKAVVRGLEQIASGVRAVSWS